MDGRILEVIDLTTNRRQRVAFSGRVKAAPTSSSELAMPESRAEPFTHRAP